MGLNKSSSFPYLPFVVWETFSNSTKMWYSLGYGDQCFRTCNLRTWASIGMNVQSSACCSLRNLKGGELPGVGGWERGGWGKCSERSTGGLSSEEGKLPLLSTLRSVSGVIEGVGVVPGQPIEVLKQ